MVHEIDVTHQNVIVARLADFCQYSSRISRYESDPWGYMRLKLYELEEPVSKLKQDQLMAAADSFITKLKRNRVKEPDIIEFKTTIHDYLSPSDYIDVAFNLNPESLSNPIKREIVSK